NAAVDITGTIDAKIAALRRHASQLGDRDPSEMIRAWAREEARKAGTRGARAKGKGTGDRSSTGPKYCESFRVMRIRQREEEPEAGG
ncbi:MAG: hypothetical protein ACM31I_06845, partial [Deltaproteobacteria bacterium]